MGVDLFWKGSGITALVSHGAIWNSDWVSETQLKISTLLYDQLIFVHNMGAAEHILELRSSVGGEDSAKKQVLELWKMNTDFAEAYNIYGPGPGTTEWPWQKGPESLKAATRAVLQELYGEVPTENTGSYDVYKHGGYMMSDILYWQKNFPDSTFIADPYTERVLSHLRNPNAIDAEGAFGWIETIIPNMSSIEWSDILDLRRSPFLSGFRSKFSELCSEAKISELPRYYQEALEGIADVCRPNPAKDAAVGIAGNIPGLPVNPVSVASSVASVQKSRKLKGDFGWVFFVRDLKKRTAD